MKNVTITVDEEVFRWARVWAAEKNTSVSRLLGETLQEKMETEFTFGKARNRYLARKPVALKDPQSTYSAREDLYDR